MTRLAEITIHTLASVSLGGVIEAGSFWGTAILLTVVVALILIYVYEGEE